MTKHNRVTAEQKSDVFHKFCKEKGYPNNEKSISEMAFEFAEHFALQVATEAVEEERENLKLNTNWSWHGEQILKNIKNRL